MISFCILTIANIHVKLTRKNAYSNFFNMDIKIKVTTPSSDNRSSPEYRPQIRIGSKF